MIHIVIVAKCGCKGCGPWRKECFVVCQEFRLPGMCRSADEQWVSWTSNVTTETG